MTLAIFNITLPNFSQRNLMNEVMMDWTTDSDEVNACGIRMALSYIFFILLGR
jgi:hypothetical protein